MDGPCKQLIPYIAGELTEKEEKQFKHHLDQCKTCSEEYSDMSGAWNSLQYDFKEKEVPAALKKEVMEYVLATESERPSSRPASWLDSLKKQFTPLTSGLVLAMAAVICFLGLNSPYFQEFKAALQTDQIATQTLNTWSFEGTDINQRELTGIAAVIQEDKSKKLIVQMRNMPALKGSEVYQVWLLKDGERENAGIFKPDRKGTGTLSFSLKKDIRFDQIGITVEPDDTSRRPRGKKVAGTG